MLLFIKLIITCSINLESARIVAFAGIGINFNSIFEAIVDADIKVVMSIKNCFTLSFFLTILAIIISAMGLFGLASYTAEQRTKEIGVRKVLGASVGQIMNMLTKDFIKLVLIANIFAWPVSYLLAKNWLTNFSYQIDIPVLPFVFATFLAVIIALATVSSQAYFAANSDPVNALKYE